MQFKKSTVVGVLIAVYLSTGSWCHYIPEKKMPLANKKNESSPHKSETIQICGEELTSLLLEACDGIVQSLNQVNSSKGGPETKLTEDCCDQKCPLDNLQSYCGQTPLFVTTKTLRGKLLNKVNFRSRNSGAGSRTNSSRKEETKPRAEVRIEKRRRGKEPGAKGRKKRKRSFKWKCAFNSFGHFLLKLDHTNDNQKPNFINRTWPSIQVGTISPEIDKFGGQPTVVVKKNRINSV